MRAYVATTGALFALVTLTHLWRMVVEPRVTADPWFIAFTVVAIGFALWAGRLLALKRVA